MTSLENALSMTVLELSDYDEAAEALSQLGRLNKELAEQLALDIVRHDKGDEHLQASAFETLYSMNLHKGIELIRHPPEHLNSATLSAMIECTTVDSGIAAEHPEVLEAAKILKETIRHLDAEKAHRMKDAIDWFQETYPDI